MAPSVSTQIEIAAPPATVWAVLTDYERYPEWNPFMVKMSGDKAVGGRLAVTLNIPSDKPDQKGMDMNPVIQTFLPNQHLHWCGRLMGIPWLFTGHHHFVLHPNSDRTGTTTTRFEQYEHFSGIFMLVMLWVGSDLFEGTRRGFTLMNEALKERAERKKSLADSGVK